MTAVRPELEQREEPAAAAAGPAPEEPEPSPPRRHRRRWGRSMVAGVAVVAVAGVAASAALGVFGGGSGGGVSGASNLPPATAEVVRTTLVDTQRFEGDLGYGGQVTWSTSAGAADEEGQGSGGPEVVTWLPEIGDVIERGERVFSVNAEPVTLVYGSMPFYRPLRVGDSGPDVEQMEKNLDQLGYDGFTVDDEYTGATAEVVRQWQEDVGLPETGELDPARVMVADGAIRIADHLVALGDPASGHVMSYTGTDRQITVELDVADQPLVAEDMPVTVSMPDGGTADATVTEVGTVATGGESEGGGDESISIEVTITMADSADLGDWDQAPVWVDIETDRREDVLAVPLGALVALGDGGHGVQVVDGGETSYLPVETGLFTDGMVEITGGDLVESMVVGVPS